MKLAFCLSGGPRFGHRGLFRLVEALKGYDQIDFFIRTWKTDEFGITPAQFEYYLRSQGLPDTCQFKVTQVLDDNEENRPPIRGINLRIADWAPNFIVMWWGIVQSHRIFKDYVARTGEQYDLVFRMRTDMVPDGEIDLTKYTDSTKIYNANNFGDNFLFGTPEMYQLFVDYYDRYLPLFDNKPVIIHPENHLEQYFKDAGIPYECIETGVFPAWDPGEYRGRQR